MADDRRIVIELKNVVEEGVAAKTNKVAENNSKELKQILQSLFHPIQTFDNTAINRNTFVGIAAVQTLRLVKQSAFSGINYAINKYFTLHENYNAETDFSNMMTGIGKVTSFVGAIGSGAIVGSAGGVPGAVIGAVSGAVTWGVSEGFGAAQRKLQQQITISTNNYQSQFQQTRLGLTSGRGVTNQ